MTSSWTPTEQALIKRNRDFIETRGDFYYSSISNQQSILSAEFPAKGPIWASRATLPGPPDRSLLDVLMACVQDLSDENEQIKEPVSSDVKVQWSGVRKNVSAEEPEPLITEEKKFQHLVKETSSNTVIFYAHGGFYFTGSAASSRGMTMQLARACKGMCLVLENRLAPQHIFPTALFDALVAYLSLLYPPAGSFHKAISPKDIVFVGESAGGNLLLSLILLTQHIRKKYGGHVPFHGQSVPLPQPAGFASIGCHMDMTKVFPWTKLNTLFDFLAPTAPYLSNRMPTCSLWPSDPPRGEIHCDISTLLHPLISPITSATFNDLPPTFLAYGDEYLIHEGQYVAQKIASDGVAVQFHYYQRLPHVFPILYPKLEQSKHVFAEIGRFCRLCTAESASVSGKWVQYAVEEPWEAGRCRMEMAPDSVQWSRSELIERMREKQKQRVPWTGPDNVPSSL